MPYGLKRYQSSKQSQFVTFSCYWHMPQLRGGCLRDLFVECLERTRRNYRFRVYGYVVMPEHVHLLVSEPEVEMLATAIPALKISVARRANPGRSETSFPSSLPLPQIAHRKLQWNLFGGKQIPFDSAQGRLSGQSPFGMTRF